MSDTDRYQIQSVQVTTVEGETLEYTGLGWLHVYHTRVPLGDQKFEDVSNIALGLRYGSSADHPIKGI